MPIVNDSYSVITKAGRQAAIAAGVTGPKIEITGFRIGSKSATEGAVPNTSDTDVEDFVYESDASRISYSLMPDSETCQFLVTLDENVGDFDVGQIALMIGPTMFSKSILYKKSPKWKTTLPLRVGNTRTYSIELTLSDVENCINLTLLKSTYTSLPEVPTEASLPVASSSIYNTYLVRNHTFLGIPTIASRQGDDWWHTPIRITPNQGQGVIVVVPDLFDVSVGINMAVYYDVTAEKYFPADNADPLKYPIGIRTSQHEVTTLGFVRRVTSGTDIWPALNIGNVYSVGTGGTVGAPSLTAAYAPYGLAITNNLMHVNFSDNINQHYLNTLSTIVGVAPNNKAHRHTNASAGGDGFMSIDDYNKLAAPESFVVGSNGIVTAALSGNRVSVKIDQNTIKPEIQAAVLEIIATFPVNTMTIA